MEKSTPTPIPMAVIMAVIMAVEVSNRIPRNPIMPKVRILETTKGIILMNPAPHRPKGYHTEKGYHNNSHDNIFYLSLDNVFHLG